MPPLDATALRRLPWELVHGRGAMAASRLRRLLVVATHQHCHVEFQGPTYLGPGFSLRIPGSGTLIVGAGTHFRRNFLCEISGNGRVVIGAGTVFTYDCVIQCSTSVVVGERCVFAQSSLIADGNHRYRDLDRPMLEQGYDFRPITIGDDVFVTAKCTVLNDIGERSVIAANSVVTTAIPPYVLAGGAPARVIEQLRPQRRDAVDALAP